MEFWRAGSTSWLNEGGELSAAEKARDAPQPHDGFQGFYLCKDRGHLLTDGGGNNQTTSLRPPRIMPLPQFPPQRHQAVKRAQPESIHPVSEGTRVTPYG